MTGIDDLAAAIKGPRQQSAGKEVIGYGGQIVSVFPGNSGAAPSVAVDVGTDEWVITNISGPFADEIAANSTMIGRTVRIHMINGQPEIAYAMNSGSGSSIPEWTTLVQTVTVNGVTGCTAYWAWYVNTAGVCELRFLVLAPSGSLPTVTYLTVPFPDTAPTPAGNPGMPNGRGTTGKHGAAVMNYTATTVRLDPDGGFYVFSNGNPSGSGFVEGSISYQSVNR